MSFKNPDNPIDVDVTAQMLNDRLGFQYGALIHSENGTDILQNVLDSQTDQSDTQVELGIDMIHLYKENATQSNITELLSESYSLILPNKNTLEDNQDGILVVQRDDAYLNSLKSLYSQDVYSQNTRQRYPSRSLIGRFISLQDFTSLQQYWRSTSVDDPQFQDDIVYGTDTGNVTVNTSFRANEVFVGDGYETATTDDTILSQLEANLTVDGTMGVRNIVITENIQSLSDGRLKTNIEPFKDALSVVKSISPVTYDWKDKENSKKSIGFIAQNVKQVVPQLVETVKDDMLTVNYIGFIPILLRALQEQQQQINTLQSLLER